MIFDGLFRKAEVIGNLFVGEPLSRANGFPLYATDGLTRQVLASTRNGGFPGVSWSQGKTEAKSASLAGLALQLHRPAHLLHKPRTDG